MKTTSELITRFRQHLKEAEATGIWEEPNWMTLATVGEDGRPDCRVVLLKEVDENGFVFFTNYESRKGRELENFPVAALCFWWEKLGVQVRVEGKVEKVSFEESEKYFHSRPLISKLGATASQQSRPLPSHATFVKEVTVELAKRFINSEVPRPAYWGGFRVKPDRMEFWCKKEFRLHERLRYDLQPDGSWSEGLLYP